MKYSYFLYIITMLLLILILLLVILFNTDYESFQNNEDETTCLYVSSYGIRKICNNIDKCIYISDGNINSFIVPETPFILVTGHLDYTVPDDYIEKTNEILNSKNLIHWFSQNLNNTSYNKLTSIPIGLDYHTLTDEKNINLLWGDIESPKKQEEFILNLEKKVFYERIPKIYINFKNTIRGKYGMKDRKDAIEQIPISLQIIEENTISRKETWKNMTKYAFVASPHGNGLDCHRTWEALVLGCIPVVKTSSLDSLYDELPVLIVNNWYDINENLLNNTIEEFKNRNFNYDKLTLEYWNNKIKNY